MSRANGRRNRLGSITLCAASSVLVGAPESGPNVAYAQPAPLISREIPYQLDSGVITNRGNESRVMWSEVVEVTDASWLRLNFAQAELSMNWRTGEGSILRITSLDDGASQTLNAATLRQWQNTSAYFNGDKVAIELIALPDGRPNRVVLDVVTAGDPGPRLDLESICGSTDDRELSDDPRNARALPSGCTAWLINDGAGCFLTAGHCIAGGLNVVEFNVPLSNSNGTIRHPDPEDQYSVEVDSRQFVNGGIGNDWGYFGVFPNSVTGLTALQAQGGETYILDTPPTVNGQSIRITGYGTTSWPIDPAWNQVQKTHVGPYVSFSGSRLQYQTDTTGGNSGSPVVLEETGMAIGIHTHGGCGFSGGANSGTGLNNSGVTNALANPRGLCGSVILEMDPMFAGQVATGRAANLTSGQKAYLIYSLRGEGTTFVPALGIDIGLEAPRLADSAVADSDGQAEFSAPLPPNSGHRVVWLQAAEVGRASNIVMTQIN